MDKVKATVRAILRWTVTIPLATVTVILMSVTLGMIHLTDDKGEYGL